MYGEYLLKRKEENAFIIDFDNPRKYPQAFSNKIDGIPKIYIPYRDTICTTYSITHELIHDMTIIGSDDSETRTIFCEVFSLLAEKIQDQYFEKIHHMEWRKHARENYILIQEKANCLLLEYKLIDCFLNQGYISSKNLYEILGEIDFNDKALLEHIIYIMNHNELHLYLDQRYLFGDLFSDYMFDRMNDRNDTEEFLDLNEMLNYYNVEQFLSYLDLELIPGTTIFNLTEYSYKKLEQSYIQKIKRIG